MNFPIADKARILHQFSEAGQHGVLLRETWTPRTAANPLQHLRPLESGPTRDPGEDGGVIVAGSFQCPAAGARAAVEELPEQRGGASGSPGNGLDYPGGPLEDPRLESSGRGFGRSAGGEDMGDRDGHCGDDRTAQAHRPGDGVSLPVPQGSLQGPTDVVGSALELCPWERGAGSGHCPVLDRLRCVSHAGLSSPAGAKRPVTTGTLATLVNPVHKLGPAALPCRPAVRVQSTFCLTRGPLRMDPRVCLRSFSASCGQCGWIRIATG